MDGFRSGERLAAQTQPADSPEARRPPGPGPARMLPSIADGQLVQLHGGCSRRGLQVFPTPAPEPGETRMPSTAFPGGRLCCDFFYTTQGWRRRSRNKRCRGRCHHQLEFSALRGL